MKPIKNGPNLPRRDIDSAKIEYYQMGGRSAEASANEGTSDFFMVDGEPMSSQELVRLLRAEGYSGKNLVNAVDDLTANLDPRGTYTREGLHEAVSLQQKGARMPSDSQEYKDLSDRIARLRGSHGKVFRHFAHEGAPVPDGYMDPSTDVRNLIKGLSSFSRR